MASQVFSGSGNFSYTNNTGQNVRIIINYCRFTSSATYQSTMGWAGNTIDLPVGSNITFGRNLAFSFQDSGVGRFNSNNMFGANGSLPTEIMIAPGQTFSITANTVTPSAIDVYNIVVIPEAG